MKTLTILITILLTACVPYKRDGVWVTESLFTTPDVRTDLVQTRVTVEVMSYDQLAIKCAEWPRAVACATADGHINLQGEPATHTMLLNVQFMDWGDIGDKCGRFKEPACHDSTTLYLYEYDITDPYKMGVIGDHLAHMMNINVGMNRRHSLGHELFHTLGYEDPFVFPWSVNLPD